MTRGHKGSFHAKYEEALWLGAGRWASRALLVGMWGACWGLAPSTHPDYLEGGQIDNWIAISLDVKDGWWGFA